MKTSRWSNLAEGAGWGVAFWSAYAILEYFLYSVVSLLRDPLGVFTLLHWRLSGILFDCYWILGCLAGAAAGVTLARWDLRRPERGRLPAILSLLVAVQINICFAFPLRIFPVLLFVVAAILTAAILWELRHPGSVFANWVDFHPFLLAVLLISPVWLSTEGLDLYPGRVKMFAVMLCLAATCIANWLLRRSPRWPAGMHFFTGLALLFAMVLVCDVKSGQRKLPAAVVMPSIADPGRSPVVLFSFDTTRADHTSVDGYWRKTTPNLAEFAAGATVFPNAMAASDMTLSSHASMFTGVYPSWHGARVTNGLPRPLDDKLPTLAGILSEKGYLTAGVAANTAYLTPRWGLSRGFAFFDVKSNIEMLSAERRFELRQGMRAVLNSIMSTAEFDLMYRRAEEIDNAVLSTMEQPQVRGRSFFLFVNYMDAHVPYLPPPPYISAYLGSRPQVTLARLRSLEEEMRNRPTHLGRDECERLTAQYDSGIAYEDFAFGRLVQWLKTRGLYNNALIVVTADHGESFGERGNVGHGFSVHGEQVHVPLVVKYPRQTAAAVVSAPVSQVDLLPTVLDTLGYRIPRHVQGISLRRPDELSNRTILAESSTGRALQSGAMKLIVPTSGKREVYDLIKDPSEIHDLYGTGATTSQLLESAFQQWMVRVPHRTATAQTPADKAELRRLRGLGYVQ